MEKIGKKCGDTRALAEQLTADTTRRIEILGLDRVGVYAADFAENLIAIRLTTSYGILPLDNVRFGQAHKRERGSNVR